MARPRTSPEHKKELARLRKRKERAKNRAERAQRPLLSDATYGLVSDQFAAYVREHYQDFIEGSLHAGGVIFTGDFAEEDHAGVYPEKEEWEEGFDVPLNSLNRTVVMIQGMIDAAQELSRLVNGFKLQEIDKRIDEAEAAARPATEIEALHRIKTRLRRSKQFRLPVYTVHGQ